MRLFFALWPDEATRDRLAAVTGMLPAKRGRPVPRDNLHLTLAFLGDVDENTVESLKGRMDAVRAEPFSLDFDRVGGFRRARVVWLAPADTPDAMNDLVGQINATVRACGIKPDDKPFRPHLTLVRKAAPPAKRLDFEPIHWNIKEFCLVESVTRPEGAEYRVLQRRALSKA